MPPSIFAAQLNSALCRPIGDSLMRTVKYERIEFHQNEPEQLTAPLAEFVLDVPYLTCHGVIPPRHVLNEVFNSGGGDAGMSPGAVWEPFSISEDEYTALVADLLELDLHEVATSGRARFVPKTLSVDSEVTGPKTHLEWITKIAAKYRPGPQTCWLRDSRPKIR